MRPLLCVTVTAPTTAELRRRRDAVPAADLIELRLDSVSDPDVAGALAFLGIGREREKDIASALEELRESVD